MSSVGPSRPCPKAVITMLKSPKLPICGGCAHKRETVSKRPYCRRWAQRWSRKHSSLMRIGGDSIHRRIGHHDENGGIDFGTRDAGCRRGGWAAHRGRDSGASPDHRAGGPFQHSHGRAGTAREDAPRILRRSARHIREFDGECRKAATRLPTAPQHRHGTRRDGARNAQVVKRLAERFRDGSSSVMSSMSQREPAG